MPVRSVLIACLILAAVVLVFTGCPKKRDAAENPTPVPLTNGHAPADNTTAPAANAEEPAATPSSKAAPGKIGEAPSTDGLALADVKCAKCHTLDRLAKHPGNVAHWTELCQDMAKKKAGWISDAEAVAIAKALAAKYPAT